MLNAQSTLNVKAFVEGYYLDTPGVMKAIIDPVAQPLLFDTITVELHNTSDTTTAFSEKAVFDIYGNGSVTVPALLFGNYYYVVLKHRNSIETWSSLPVLVTSVTDYDFTPAISMAYGDNMKWVTNAACLFSGDINSDGLIDTLDMNIVDSLSVLFIYEYYNIADVNGDSAVDAFDMNLVSINMNAFISVVSPVATGISEADWKQMKIYPCPASQYVNIENTVKGKNVIISDSEGKQAIACTASHGMTAIDVSQLSEGIYIISSRGTGSERLIIKR